MHVSALCRSEIDILLLMLTVFRMRAFGAGLAEEDKETNS